MVDIWFIALVFITVISTISFSHKLNKAYDRIERLTIKLNVAKSDMAKRKRLEAFSFGTEDEADFLKRTAPTFESVCQHTQDSTFKRLAAGWINAKAEIEKTFTEKLKDLVKDDETLDAVCDLIDLRKQTLEEAFAKCLKDVGFSFRPVEIGYGTPRRGVILRLQSWVCNACTIETNFDPLRQYSYLIGAKKEKKQSY